MASPSGDAPPQPPDDDKAKWEEHLSEEFLRIPMPNSMLGTTREFTAEQLRGRMRLATEAFREYLDFRTAHHLGYPYNLSYKSQEDLKWTLGYGLNNLGDPFESSRYGLHSRCFEKSCVRWFCELWDIPAEEAFGYVTGSGSECNMYGLYVAREAHPDGVVLTSHDTHYSVLKYAAMFRMEARPVRSSLNGEIDYEHLAEVARGVAAEGRSVILNINVGTTVKGAVDDAGRAIRAVRDAGVAEDRMHVHVDGALFALCCHFIDHPKLNQLGFSALPIDSFSVSAHKMLGCCLPAGVVIVRRKHTERLFSTVPYLNSTDSTIMGSRNGHAPLFVWHQLMYKVATGELRSDIDRCFQFARYVAHRMRSEVRNARVLLNELSTTVVFALPPASGATEAFVDKWQLACVEGIAHIVAMPSHRRERLDAFVDEYVRMMNAAAPEERRNVDKQLPLDGWQKEEKEE